MAKASRETTSQVEQLDGFEGRYEELGGYTVGFERFDVDMDPAPLFQGLPDDRCQSPHWGVVLKGGITFTYADGQDVVGPGEAYYARPGHTPQLKAGTELVEFSPTEDLMRTMEVVERNAASMSANA